MSQSKLIKPDKPFTRKPWNSIDLAGLLTYSLPEPSHPTEADSGRSDPVAFLRAYSSGNCSGLTPDSHFQSSSRFRITDTSINAKEMKNYLRKALGYDFFKQFAVNMSNHEKISPD